jgi:hypothetical protein
MNMTHPSAIPLLNPPAPPVNVADPNILSENIFSLTKDRFRSEYLPCPQKRFTWRSWLRHPQGFYWF